MWVKDTHVPTQVRVICLLILLLLTLLIKCMLAVDRTVYQVRVLAVQA